MSLPLTWADKRNSLALADFIAKHGAEYCMTAEEINEMRDAVNEMAVIQQSVCLGPAEPTDTPAGTGANYWEVIVPGTYTNFGGVALPENKRGLIYRNATGAFSISFSGLDLSGKANIIYVNNEINKIQKTIIPINGFCITTESTVDWENPTLDAGWKFATEECKEGDVFNVAGFVFSAGIPVWGFLDSDDKLISFCAVSGLQFIDTITAPTRTVRIIHNSVASYENYLVKSGSIVSKLSEKVVELDTKQRNYTDGIVLQNAYINSSVGVTVDWENPILDNGWKYATEVCKEGDIFDLRGFSFSAGIPAYAFLNSSDIVIQISTDINVLVNKLVEAPLNATRIVFTSQNGYGAYLKKTVSAVSKLETKIEALNNAISPINAIVSSSGLTTLVNKSSTNTTDWGWLNLTSAYIGYDVTALNDSILKTARILRFNSENTTIDTLDAEFLVGIIDQRKNFIPSRTYAVTGVRDGNLAGVPSFEYIKFTFSQDAYIKEGELCFIKVNSISHVIEQTIAINAANYDASNKLLYTRELTSSLTELTVKGAMEFVIETLPYNSIFSTKAELNEVNSKVVNLATTVTNNTIFNDSATGENFKIKVFNGNIILKSLNVGRLLVIGNSMVKDAFTAQTGDDRAMSASVPNHGFADYMATKFGATLNKMNVFEFEHDFAVTTTPYDFATKWNLTNDYDAVILSIGANTPTIDPTSLANLLVNYGQAIEYIKTTCLTAEIYVHTPFQSDSISDTVQAAALAHYVPFIDTSVFHEYPNNSDIFKVGDYCINSVGTYFSIEDIGIARHPSDAGHIRIANTLLAALASTPYTQNSYSITLNQVVGGTIETPNTMWVKDGIVTIRITPDSGKTISSLAVIKSDSSTVMVTQRTNSHGVFYTFVMPNKDVIVTPTWV